MSNRTHLQPNINPTVNPNFKGDVTVAGDLTVNGTSTLPIIESGDINSAGTVTSNGLEVTTNAQLPAETLVGTASPNLITFGGDVSDLEIDGTVAYFAAPRAGVIVGIVAVPQDAIEGGDATLTATIGATDIVGGVVTLPLIGTAAGKPGYATPTDDNIVVLGSIIKITVGGGNTAVTTARVTFTLQYE